MTSANHAALERALSSTQVRPLLAGAAATATALIETSLLVLGAGAAPSRADLDLLGGALATLSGGGRTPAQIDEIVRAQIALIERDGLPVRASYLGRSLEGDPARRAAYALAVGVALLRGPLDSDAEDALETVGDALELDEADAEAITNDLRRALGR